VGPALRWIGSFSTPTAVMVFYAAAVLGAIATLITKSGPGGLLGGLIIVGAVLSALGIRRRKLYLLLPLPTLTYLVLAILTGAVHDHGTDGSTTGLGVNFLQWIGNGFLSLFAATILVGVIYGTRALASRLLVSGSFPMSEQRSAAGQPAVAFASPKARPASRSGASRPEGRREGRRRPTSEAEPEAWYVPPRDREPRKDPDRPKDPPRTDDRRDRRWSTDGWRLDVRRPRFENRAESVPADASGSRSAPANRPRKPPRDSDEPPTRSDSPPRASREPRAGTDPRARRDARANLDAQASRDPRADSDRRDGAAPRRDRDAWGRRGPRDR
jgi:hypothetical protein